MIRLGLELLQVDMAIHEQQIGDVADGMMHLSKGVVLDLPGGEVFSVGQREIAGHHQRRRLEDIFRALIPQDFGGAVFKRRTLALNIQNRRLIGVTAAVNFVEALVIKRRVQARTRPVTFVERALRNKFAHVRREEPFPESLSRGIDVRSLSAPHIMPAVLKQGIAGRFIVRIILREASVVVGSVEQNAHADLSEVGSAFRLFAQQFGLAQRRQKHARQDCNDGDDLQQFNQGEGATCYRRSA